MTAEAAQAGGVPNLILTHFSGRYQRSRAAGGNCIDEILTEAVQFYHGNIGLASDLSCWAVNRSGQLIPPDRDILARLIHSEVES